MTEHNRTPTELAGLLIALEHAELRLGPRELLRLHQVFAAEPGLGALSRPAPSGAAAERDRHRRRLRAILRAALLTRAEDGADFDRVFDAWYPETLAELDASRPLPTGGRRPVVRPEPTPAPQVTPSLPALAPVDSPPPQRRRLWPWLLTLLAAELLLVAALRIWEPPVPVLEPRPREEDPIEPLPTLPLPVPATYQTLLPSIQVQPPPADWQRWRGWPQLLLALLAAGAAFWAWREVARRPWLPVPSFGPPAPGGPPRYYLPAPTGGAELLLTPAEQGHLVWGIGRFVTGEPSRRLDLPATVRATARAGGLAMPRFAQAARHREVWLWTDGSSADGQAARLADALAGLLGRHGLRVERAEFRGLPERLTGADNHCFSPRELEDRRAGALVCILTDGRLLLRRHRDDAAARLRIDALLRLLAHWPRLAWVDLGSGADTPASAPASALAALLARHGLSCIAPADLIGFLTSPDGSPRRRARLVRHPAARERALRIWAAACALPPAPVEDAEALALRRHLGLDCPPWDLALLRAAAPGPGGRLCWPHAERLALLGWLAGLARLDADTDADADADADADTDTDSDPDPDPEVDVDAGPTGEQDPLRRALSYWQQRYDKLLSTDGAPPADTAARRRLRAEQALLRLWREPSKAIEALVELEQADPPGGTTATLIRTELRDLAPADAPAGDRAHCIRLPWRWLDLSATERLILHQLGFGCDSLQGRSPRRSGRHWLGLGLAAGLTASALIAALNSPTPPVLGKPEILHVGADTQAPRDRLAEDPNGRWQLTTQSPDQLAHRADIPAGSRVEVTWRASRHPCIEPLADGAELHRCAAGPITPSPVDEIGPAYRRLAVLAADPETPGVRALTEALLAGGSAHQVLIDPHWPAQRAALTGPTDRLHPEDRLLLLTPTGPATDATGGDDQAWRPDADSLQLGVADWAGLATALAGTNAGTCQPAAALWPQATPLDGDPASFQLGGTGGGCRPGQWTDPDSGIDYIALCGGEFAMGSPEDEPGRYDDEGPRHRVRIGPFSLARTETTNAQYRRLHPDHEGADALPVADVNWSEAQAFCAAVGARLSTEAEWEYAARAGTDSPWSFGDNAALLGDHAWYHENSDNQAHPVATRAPNPWGLYDMHGNLYEWVADWYADRYPTDAEPRIDPRGPASGSFRVLRGGAFSNVSLFLRSSFRNGNRPEGRVRNIGFRCARAPRRQP